MLLIAMVFILLIVLLYMYPINVIAQTSKSHL